MSIGIFLVWRNSLYNIAFLEKRFWDSPTEILLILKESEKDGLTIEEWHPVLTRK